MPLDFAQSERSTVGVEWELQLVDKDSNDLRQAADAVIRKAREDKELSPHIHREMLLNTTEVTSGKRTKISECLEDLRYGVTALRPITDALRIDLSSAGTHPFARPAYQRVTDSRRYAELVDRTQYWGRQMLLYGVHVHVGVEDRDKVLPIVNALITRAASTTMPVMALRSMVEANRNPMSCLLASACRFQRVQVERFSPTIMVTVQPICSITSRGRSSARTVAGRTSLLMTTRVQVVASSPRTCVARCRHSAVRSARERTSFSGRVANVAWARSFNTILGLG